MNICFLLGGFGGIGGIGRVTSILANELCKDESNKIHTLSYYNNGLTNHYSLNERVHQSHLFNNPINMTKGILKGGVLKLRKYLIEKDIDILIACGALYFPIAIMSTKGIKTKNICWEHSNALNEKDHSFQMFSRKTGAKYSDYIVTLTKKDKMNYIEKFRSINVAQIYNPIDKSILQESESYNANSKKIISVGRLTYPKNFEQLIDVAHEVFKDNDEWSWDIYGEGELRGDIEKKIAKYNLENRVYLKGSVDDIYKRYSGYAFLVMTSISEGFPMTLLEGLANNLPLISFDIQTGPNEIITNMENGYLITPFKTNDMVSKINILISQKEQRIKMSKSSKEISKKFYIDKILLQWEELFEKVLHS